ncbi:MAG: hypothetical protein N2444_00545 [Methylocystis sp.]|nr:hypothetical protein [Methylocystis sp.]
MEHGLNVENLNLVGWGVVGEPKEELLVRTPEGMGIDVRGYQTGDYWDGNGKFLGPDCDGIVPIYMTPTGEQFPKDATAYPYVE